MRSKFNQLGIAKILFAGLCLCLPPFANTQSTAIKPLTNSSPHAASKFSDVYSGKHFHALNTGLSSGAKSNTIGISAGPRNALQTQAFSLTLPADADIGTLKATLNGHDVSARFKGSSGFVDDADGLSTVKNVLNITVKTSSGGMASGHWRSMAGLPLKNVKAPQTLEATASAKVAAVVRPQAVPDNPVNPVCDPVTMCPAWLAPSVRFDTLSKGNWNGSAPWVVVNGVGYGGSASTIQAQYVLLVLNRQTLAYEDFEYFNSGGGTVTSWVNAKKYTSNDLVIVATAAGASAIDSGLDMSAIGGTNWANYPSTSPMPSSYMIVGYGGAPANSVYENWGPVGGYAVGSLLEDANGNYNFQSTDILEYAIEPHDPGYGNAPTIRMAVPANQTIEGETQVLFVANATGNQNGIWMLTIDRENPMIPYNGSGSGCNDLDYQNSTRVLVGCGQFFAVGAGPGDLDALWSDLAAAINAVPYNQLLFLQSIGTVGSSQAQTVQNATWYVDTSYTGFRSFAAALNNFGGTPYAVAGPTYTNQDNYAFVGFLGQGNALTGAVAELSTAMPGQIGVLHGTLQRNSNGYYQPAQSSAEQQGLFNDKGGISDSDFLLAVASYQQPVEWPSNSGTALLLNASSIAGQQAAYRFISHWLLAGYYLKTISGPHQDDLHYFFTGSVNTSLDYHTMDPANLQFPGAGLWTTFGCTASDGSTCTFTGAGDSAPSSFTLADFNAVKAQVSLEVVYLTNTLQYLVTGSTNMKDIVASGNANVGLALTAAANAIQGSAMGNLNAQQVASSKVTFSWQSIFGALGSGISIIANLEGAGAAVGLYDDAVANWKTAKAAVSVANSVGALLSTIGSSGSIGSASAKTSFLSTSPQPFAQLTTSVGQLATADLQSPLLTGFDSTVDNITADWERLRQIGLRTTNTTDTTFYAPNQLQQITAINGLTSASAKSFYFSLLPSAYSLHYWPGVTWAVPGTGYSQPTVGSIQTHTEYDSCNAFYLTPNQPPGSLIGQLTQYQSIAYFSAGNPIQPFTADQGYIDFWVMDGTVSKAGTQSVNISVINADLANNLFAPDQLNVPMYQMFSVNGPMASVTQNASDTTGGKNFSGWSNDNICDASDPAWTDSSGGGLTAPPPGGGVAKKLLTTTSVTSPSSGVLGHDAVFTAQVVTGTAPVTSGSVYISVDGAVVGDPLIGALGTASWTMPNGLALGIHQIQADYAPGTGYEGSSAVPSTYTVYSESPDILISLASSSMNVSYSSASSPVAVQVGSVAGLAGNVVLSCSGLPAGLSCSFNSQSLTLAANGTVNASVQVIPSATAQTTATASSLTKIYAAVFILPLIGLGSLRRGRLAVTLSTMLVVATFSLSGCSGSSSSSTPAHETGTKTITISASVGSVSRSVGMNINIQP